MTEVTEGATVAEPVNTATFQTNEEPAVVTPAATEDAGQKAESAEKPELTPEQKNERWLRTKATKAERNNARLHAENEQMREQLSKLAPPQQPAGNQAVDPVALADHIATAREVAKTSNDVVADGKKRFAATWDTALTTVIAEAGPLIDPRTMLPTPLGEAILASDDKAALLHHIGSDPALADELSDLTPTQLGRRIARIEAEMKAKPAKATSNAPPPINPLNGNASGNTVDLETADFATYERERAKSNPIWMRR